MGDTHDWWASESTDAEKTEVIRPTDDEKTVVLPPDAQPQSAFAPTDFGDTSDTNEETTVVVPRPAATPTPALQPPRSGFSPPRDPASSAVPPPLQTATPAPAWTAQPYRNAANPYGFPQPGVIASTPAQTVKRRASTTWLIPVVAAVAVILAALTVLAVVRPGPVKAVLNDKLDAAKAQSQVQAVLTDPGAGYGLTDVSNVICNRGANPVISKGATFTCDFTIGGRQNQAIMTFLDDSGTYSVGRPQ